MAGTACHTERCGKPSCFLCRPRLSPVAASLKKAFLEETGALSLQPERESACLTGTCCSHLLPLPSLHSILHCSASLSLSLYPPSSPPSHSTSPSLPSFLSSPLFQKQTPPLHVLCLSLNKWRNGQQGSHVHAGENSGEGEMQNSMPRSPVSEGKRCGL